MPRASKSAEEKSSSESKNPEEGFCKKTLYITPGQDMFLKRKVIELRRKAPKDQVDGINESTVFQGLLNIWMTFEKTQ